MATGKFVLALFVNLGIAGLSASISYAETPKIFNADTALSAPVTQREFRNLMEEIPSVGTSVAVIKDGKLLYSDAMGFADMEMKTVATTETVFRLASISKTITSVAAMTLVENGKIDLDKPIQLYYPDFPKKQWEITPRQCLSHLAGIRSYKGLELYSVKNYTNAITPLDIFKDDALVHEPGTKYLYQAYSFSLMAAIIEKVSGVPFWDYVINNVAKPSGMKSLSTDNPKKHHPKLATGYTRSIDGETTRSRFFDGTNKIPAGAMTCTAEDLTSYANALMNGTLLTSESKTMMWTKQPLKKGGTTKYGLGWNLGQPDAARTPYHTGGQPGVSTILYLIPEKSFAVAILCNMEKIDMVPYAKKYTEMVVGKLK